jgi:hypothetical protein
MKFKELTQDTIDKAKAIYWNRDLSWDERIEQLKTIFGKSERTTRKWCSEKLDFKETNNIGISESDQYKMAQARVFNNNKKYYLVTWAQNNTPVHGRFFKNLLAYSVFLNADVHVIPGRYKNPTSVFSDSKDDFWEDEVLPYLDATRNDIGNNITIFGDIKIQPTASNPMSDLQGLCYMTSCIFGSPKIQLQSIPVLPGNKPRIMLTTGACTVANYTDSKSGKKGEFHHTYGAVIVEVKDDETVFFRQITAKNNGDFNDLYWNVSNGEVSKNNSIEAIIYGDIHSGEHDDQLLNTTQTQIIDKLTPNHIILHDTFSGLSINPHEAKDPFLLYGKQFHGNDDLMKELQTMAEVLSRFSKYEKSKVVIVRSNHDDFLDRWIKNEDWRKLPSLKNSRLYMQFSDMLLYQYEKDPNNVKGIIPELINNSFPNYITLGINDSYVVKGFELAMHGHLGVNGAKGSPESFRKLNTKMVSAHTHSTFRKDGLLVVGTSTRLRLNYTNGPSSWTQGHVIIDKYGKAQNIIFFDGEFTTFKVDE